VLRNNQTALGGVIYVGDPWSRTPDAAGDAVADLLALAPEGAILVVDPRDGAAPYHGPYCAAALQDALSDSNVAGVCIEAPGLRIGIEMGAVHSVRNPQSPPCLYFALDWPDSIAPLTAILEDLARQVCVIHGGMDPFASFSSAITDVSLMPEALHTLPQELRIRWQHDAPLRHLLWHHPRRLFALTVLGKAVHTAPDLADARSAGALRAWSVNQSLFIEACATELGPPRAQWQRECPELVSWLWPRTLKSPTDCPIQAPQPNVAAPDRMGEPEGPCARPL
jgi:hypothetical protein